MSHIFVKFHVTGRFVTSLLMLKSQVCRTNSLVGVSGLQSKRKYE